MPGVAMLRSRARQRVGLRVPRRAAGIPAALLGLAAVAAVAVASGPDRAWAHTVSPATIVAQLSSDAARREAGVESVTRDAKLERLLVVRVGPRWAELSAERRRELAADWWRVWRHSVANGIVAVLEVGTDRSLVSFTGDGVPRLVESGGR